MTTIAIATGEHFANSNNEVVDLIRVTFDLPPRELIQTLKFIDAHSEPAQGEPVAPEGLVILCEAMEAAIRAAGYGYKE